MPRYCPGSGQSPVGFMSTLRERDTAYGTCRECGFIKRLAHGAGYDRWLVVYHLPKKGKRDRG